MVRKVRPPDFRYVWLMPGPTSAAVAIATATIGLGAVGFGLWNSGHQPMSMALTLGASAVAALAFVRSERTVPRRDGACEVPMAIVPWGIIVTPDDSPRVLRWPAIRRVGVEVTHTLRGGTPSVVSSLVTVHTDRDVLAGRTAGSVDLESLMVDLAAYAEEATRPVSCDLEGIEPAGDGATEPVAALLMRNARHLCSTRDGAAQLGLPPGGYRTAAVRTAGPETVGLLRAVLSQSRDAPADPRPLAAFVAGLLGVRELVPDLLRLVSSPHPVVAAAAKAAALRLGAPPNRAGAVDEVALFLFDEDYALIRGWSESVPR